MKKITKSVIAVAVLAATSSVAMAELSANAAVVSNYVFRGFTYSDEKPALQGGLDYSHESGVYVGTWLSTIDNSVDTGVEYDYYLGYAREAGDFGYDLGYIVYSNTDDTKFGNDFRELYLTASYSMFSAGIYKGDQKDATNSEYKYMEVGADITDVIPMETTLSLHYGVTDPDASGADNVHDYSVALSKDFSGFGVSVNYTSEDALDNNYVWLGVSKDFSL